MEKILLLFLYVLYYELHLFFKILQIYDLEIVILLLLIISIIAIFREIIKINEVPRKIKLRSKKFINF